MIFWTVVKVALKSIAANKLRTVLTMLGVIIGVGAVIAMLGLGAGTEEKVMASVRSMGANLLTIRPGSRAGGSGVWSGSAQNLRLDDARAILAQVKDVDMVAPEVSSSYQVKFMNRNTRVQVSGQAITYFPVRNFQIEKGHVFTEADVDRGNRVAVLGPKTAVDLFAAMDPVGENIKVNGVNFRVVGVLKSKGDQGWFNPDDQVIVPLTTAMSQLMGRDYLGSIYCRVRTGANMEDVQERITQVLRRQHRIQVDQPDDFSIRNMQEMVESLDNVSKIFTMLLSGVAAVSLIVGGIGIMNIMLVTVTERTREIGVRKALGARNSDVLTQFLLEAVTISVTGGAIGVSLGVGSILLFNHLTERLSGEAYGAQIQMWSILLAFGFSALVGIFFGFYPARKAAKLDPIDALRYE
jgi:putative ABC transport system permease protein